MESMVVEEEEKQVPMNQKKEAEEEFDPEAIMMKKAGSHPWENAKGGKDLVEQT